MAVYSLIITRHQILNLNTMVRCYETLNAQADWLSELRQASKMRRRIIAKARHGRIRMNVEEQSER